jgi:hypothetical protein
VISFRYHVVTIAAVFLALAIGLLGGGAFVQPALQRQLENRTADLRSELDARLGQIDDLRLEVAGLAAFSEAALPYLTSGTLVGTPVVIVTQVGVEDEVLATTLDAFSTAGADIVTTVSASALLDSQDPAVQQELAQILGQPSAPPEDLPSLAADELAARLASPVTPAPGDDVLTELLSGGFLAPVGAPPQGATLEEIGAPGQVVVVLSGGRGEDDPALPPETFAVPLVEALVGLGQPVAAGESLLSDHPYVVLLRSSGTDGRVTVDDLDQAMGGAALVLGLDRLLASGEGGDYGAKDGAEPLPPPP